MKECLKEARKLPASEQVIFICAWAELGGYRAGWVANVYAALKGKKSVLKKYGLKSY